MRRSTVLSLPLQLVFPDLPNHVKVEGSSLATAAAGSGKEEIPKKV